MILRLNNFEFLNMFDDIVGKEIDYLQTRSIFYFDESSGM